MLKTSSLLTFLKTYLEAHENGNAPMPPAHAGTMARLLSACASQVSDMEVELSAASVSVQPVDLSHVANSNVVFLADVLKASATPTTTSNGGDAA